MIRASAPGQRERYASRVRLTYVCATILLAACAVATGPRPSALTVASGGQDDSPPSPSADSAGEKGQTPITVEPTRYLRQLSLDLRGRPPSFDELAAVAREGSVSDATIDAMLHSDDFVRQVGEWHKPLLWPNVDKFDLVARPIVAAGRIGGRRFHMFSPDPEMLGAAASKHANATLTAYFESSPGYPSCDDQVEYPPPADHGEQPAYTVVGRDRKRHRYEYYDSFGVPLPYHDGAHCPNACSSKTEAERSAPGFVPQDSMFVEMNEPGARPNPDDLDPPGKHCPASHPYRALNPCDGRGVMPYVFYQLDGFRWTTPYWSQGRALKTCAREAQTRAIGTDRGESCAAARLDRSCGCGPDGAYCKPSQALSYRYEASRAEHVLRQAINEEPLAIVKDVVARDEDYFDVFRTRRAFANGPLAYFYRYQTAAVSALEIAPPTPPDALPRIPYDDPTWHEYARGDEHAGVLTTTAYLLRFPTERARVSQFRNAMMCHPFTPFVASFPGPNEECTREPNLAKRCGCRNCHAAIEPMGAWFGRWVERGAKYLEPTSFPAFDPSCADRSRWHNAKCNEYVAPTEGADTAGTLLGYLYRTADEQKRIGEGPRGLVAAAIESGELESCTVTTAWNRLIGRPMSEAETLARLPELERDFESNHHSYRDLVRTIATSPEARRIDAQARAPRRLDADQLRASLVAATGFTWIAPHMVSDPDTPGGRSETPNADMIEVLAGTLGRANYSTTTSEQVDPAITFSKLAGDAARSACRASVEADLKETDAASRRILRLVTARDTLASEVAGVRRNLSYLALRFWGRAVTPDDAELAPLATLFGRATSAQGASPSDGWRAVCIALATDPKFLTY